MNYINVLLLAGIITAPTMPMIKIGDNNEGPINIGKDNGTVNIDNGFWGLKIGNNTKGLSIPNGQVLCEGECQGQITYWNNLGKTVINCFKGNCIETRYNALGRQISPELPSITPQNDQNTTILSRIKDHPYIAGVLAVAAGYVAYKLYKRLKRA